MKRIAIGLVVLVVVLIILGIVVLPGIVRPAVERVAEQRGVDVKIGRLRVGVLRGNVAMGDVHVPNLPGYTDPELGAFDDFAVNTELLPLLRGQIRVQSVALAEPQVNAERLADGAVNVSQLLERLATGGGAPTAEEGEPAAETGELPPFKISRVTIDGMALRWTDHQLPRKAGHVTAEDVDVVVKNIYNPMPPGTQDTTFSATGRLGGDASGTFSAKGRGNFLNEKLDFTMTVDLENVQLTGFEAWYATAPIQPSGGTVSGTVDATCKQNQLDAVVKLAFDSLALQPNQQSTLVARVPSQALSSLGQVNPNRKVEVHVSGDLTNPRFHVVQAIIMSVSADFVQAAGAIAGVTVDTTKLLAGTAGQLGAGAADALQQAGGGVGEAGKQALEEAGGALGGLLGGLRGRTPDSSDAGATQE